jgi:D-aspartate ligase
MISEDPGRCAVVLCLTATGLSVARSLGYRGIEIYGADSKKWRIGHYSKYVSASSTLSCKEDRNQLIENLVNYAVKRNEAPVLFAAGDDEVLFASEYSKILRRHFLMPESYTEEFTGLLVSKINLYRQCIELGADLPVTYFPQTMRDVEDISKKVPYPAIVKPDFGHEWRKRLKGQKVLLASSPAHLLSAYHSHSIEPRTTVIQEVIPGREENIAIFGGYFDRDYEPLSVFTGKKIRQYPPMFGSGCFCESLWISEIADMSISLMQKMRYHGVCGTEYKWDPRDGKWKFMEVNFRPTLWFALTRAAGTDVVYDAYLDLAGCKVRKKIGTQKDGILWQYWSRDAISLFHYWKERDISWTKFKQFIIPRKEDAILSRRDWNTTLMYPFYILCESITHI